MEYLGGIAAAILIIHGIKRYTSDDMGGSAYAEMTPITPGMAAGFPPGTTPRTPYPGPNKTPMAAGAGPTPALDHNKTITTQDEFVQAAMSPGGAMVAITADWCGHCKAMKPEFDAARSASPIPMYWVDTKKFDESDLDGIEGFPTLRYYKGGIGKDYSGDRTAQGMLDFINKQQ